MCTLCLIVEFIISDAIDSCQKNTAFLGSEESVSELVHLKNRTSPLTEFSRINNFRGISNILKTKYSNCGRKNIQDSLKLGSVNVVNTDIDRRSFRLLGDKKPNYIKDNQNITRETLTTHVKESEVMYQIYKSSYFICSYQTKHFNSG